MDSIVLYEKNLVDTKNRRSDVTGQFASDIDRFKELKAVSGGGIESAGVT